MNFEMITKLISPVKGLQMLKAGIEKNLGRPVNHFQIDYLAAKKELSFKVWLDNEKTIREPYKGANKEMMIFIIENLSKQKLQDGETLDVVTCEYNPDETVSLYAYVTNKEGEKIKHELKNYKP